MPDLAATLPRISILLQPWILNLLRALDRRRVNYEALDAAAKDRFIGGDLQKTFHNTTMSILPEPPPFLS